MTRDEGLAPSRADLPNGLNGPIDLRKTNPALYRMAMTYAVICVLLGVNYFVLTPTFPVYDVSYVIWASLFVAIGASKLVLLNFQRNLLLVKVFMAFTLAYMIFFGIGTTQPFFDGVGSLALPIMFLALALIELPLLIEPFNPWAGRE